MRPFRRVSLGTASFFALALQCTAHANAILPGSALSTAEIDDPLFGNRKAFTVNIPAGWQLQGTVVAGLGRDMPSPTFRAYSPDGLTEIRLLPAFNWVVMAKPEREGLGVPPDHVYLGGALTAREFLDRYVEALYSTPAPRPTLPRDPMPPLDRRPPIAKPADVGSSYQQQVDKLLARMNAYKPPTPGMAQDTAGTTAALRVQSTNGSFEIEQRLRARVICNLWRKPVAGELGHCAARIDVLKAPKGQLDALIDFADAHNLATAKNDGVWLSEVVAQLTRADRDQPHFGDPEHREDRVALALLLLQAAELGWASSDQRRAGWWRQCDRAQARPHVSGGKQAPTDWADYAIDLTRQRGADCEPAQPGTMRVWVSASGQRYSTMDPGANPNGVLAGTWTEENATARSASKHQPSQPR